jgi:alpha-L-fucosidase
MRKAQRELRTICLLALMATVLGGKGARAQQMPAPAPFPEVPVTGPRDSVTMQDPATFPEVKMTFPIAAGPYQPTWESISNQYPGAPEWLNDAKFGIWVHFGPQSAGQSGDWYARKMYLPGTVAYKNHIRDFGHPSVSGYKEILHTWNPIRLDPKMLVKTYKEAGARFLLVQGVHHDNFDNWNSAYQPWNSVNMGPKRDLLGEWAKASRAQGMRFGVAFHHEYTWWWYQPAFNSDVTGAKAGVAYDGAQTLADGKGKWWEGYDPRLLYGIDLHAYKGLDPVPFRPEGGIFQNHLAYANWYVTRWALRIMDVINKYDPDFIFTDGDSTGPYTGYATGTGYKSDAMQRVIADYYNKALERHGAVDTISIVKFHPPTRGVATTFEGTFPDAIKSDQVWIGENAVGDWFYAPNFTYSARALVLYMLECVSRGGDYAVNISLKPDGSLDAGSQQMLHRVGLWMKVNGPGIYGSKPWTKFGEGRRGADGKLRSLPQGQLGTKQASFHFGVEDFRFTSGKDGEIYAFALAGAVPGKTIKIRAFSLENGGETVRQVALLGSRQRVKWSQQSDGLVITYPSDIDSNMPSTFRIR